MNDLTNFDPIAVGDEIAALETEAQDKLAEAKDEFKSRSEKIAAILWDVKQHHPEHLDAICERAKIGRSRRYELLRIGSGRETAKQSRKESAKRQTKLDFGQFRQPPGERYFVGKWIRREFCHCLGLAETVKKLTSPIFDASDDR
jgi:hypothetical protein